MQRSSETIGARPAACLRAGFATALLIVLAACGGGGNDAPAPAAPDRSPAAAVSVDTSAGEQPVDVRVAQGPDGDGFVVWRADDGTRHNLWASRYRAADGSWSAPVRLETTDDDIRADFDVWVDADGNAAALWSDAAGLAGARFEAAGGGWTAPFRPARTGFQGTGSEVAFNVVPDPSGRQRSGVYFDPVRQTVSGVLVESLDGTGDIEGGPVAVDGRGNAVGIFAPTRTGAAYLVGNDFDAALGGWQRLQEGQTLLDGIPGSDVSGGAYNNDVQLARSVDGDFLAAWQVIDESGLPDDIRIAHFTRSGRQWSGGGPAVVGTPALDLRLQRLESGADGRTRLLTWTQNDGPRTALKALRLFRGGDACDAVRTIDAAVGGGAARADLAVAPGGDALAVWQQFEGGRVDDGSRSNIAYARFDVATLTWQPARFAETAPGNADAPRVSANGGRALLAWVQAEAGMRRVKALPMSLGAGPAP